MKTFSNVPAVLCEKFVAAFDMFADGGHDSQLGDILAIGRVLGLLIGEPLSTVDHMLVTLCADLAEAAVRYIATQNYGEQNQGTDYGHIIDRAEAKLLVAGRAVCAAIKSAAVST